MITKTINEVYDLKTNFIYDDNECYLKVEIELTNIETGEKDNNYHLFCKDDYDYTKRNIAKIIGKDDLTKEEFEQEYTNRIQIK